MSSHGQTPTHRKTRAPLWITHHPDPLRHSSTVPNRIPRPCSGSSTCPEPGTIRGRCPEHATEAEARRNHDRADNLDVYRSKRWRIESKHYLRANPWCSGYPEGTTCHDAATDVDHVIPLGTPGIDPFDRSNWQGLCHRHHSKKTATENRRRPR